MGVWPNSIAVLQARVMAGGVKHRLSNGIAWSGFAATPFTLLYLAPRAYIGFAKIPALSVQ